MPDPVFYSVVVSNAAGRHGSLCWSAAFATPGEANRAGKAKVDAGDATLAFVVKIGDEGKEVLARFTQPASARKIIDHYEELWDAIDPPEAS